MNYFHRINLPMKLEKFERFSLIGRIKKKTLKYKKIIFQIIELLIKFPSFRKYSVY